MKAWRKVGQPALFRHPNNHLFSWEISRQSKERPLLLPKLLLPLSPR